MSFLREKLIKLSISPYVSLHRASFISSSCSAVFTNKKIYSWLGNGVVFEWDLNSDCGSLHLGCGLGSLYMRSDPPPPQKEVQMHCIGVLLDLLCSYQSLIYLWLFQTLLSLHLLRIFKSMASMCSCFIWNEALSYRMLFISKIVSLVQFGIYFQWEPIGSEWLMKGRIEGCNNYLCP